MDNPEHGSLQPFHPTPEFGDRAAHLVARWLSAAGQVDVIEPRPHRVNRIYAPVKVRDDEALLAFAVEHTLKSGRRVVVVLGPLRLALVENGVIVSADVLETLSR